jgi:DNA-binding MarR family transcriptional regulator
MPNQDVKAAGGYSFCVNMQMLRTSHYILKAYDDAYRELGVRATQTPVLGIMARQPTATIREIADQMETERSVMSRKLQVMEKNGWIEEVVHDAGKEKSFRLTKKGRALMNKIMPIRLQVQGQLLGRLTEQEQNLLFTLCDKLKDETQD